MSEAVVKIAHSEDVIPVFCAHDRLVQIAEVQPNPRNPNQHTAEQVELLAAVIREAGWRAPITVSKRSGLVVRGHCRLLAAQLLDLAEVPVDYQEYASEAAEYADLLADNRLAELADMDKAMLAGLLGEISAAEVPIYISGYTEEEYRDLLTALAPEQVELKIADDIVPEPPTQPFSQAGDIWTLGEHLLVCGDSTQPQSFALLMPNEQAQLLITDPPYNVDYEGKTAARLRILGDKQTPPQFQAFLHDAFRNIRGKCQAGCAAYVFHSDTEGTAFRTAFVETGFVLKQCLVWVKSLFILGHSDYHWQHEPILYGWLAGERHYFVYDRSQSTVIEDGPVQLSGLKKQELLAYLRSRMAPQEHSTVIREDRPHKNDLHPTMKPVRLLARLIHNSSRPGELVLDPFAGSGSTLIACEHLKRRARCIEIDARFCDVIVKRYCDSSGRADVQCLRGGRMLAPATYRHLLPADIAK